MPLTKTNVILKPILVIHAKFTGRSQEDFVRYRCVQLFQLFHTMLQGSSALKGVTVTSSTTSASIRAVPNPVEKRQAGPRPSVSKKTQLRPSQRLTPQPLPLPPNTAGIDPRTRLGAQSLSFLGDSVFEAFVRAHYFQALGPVNAFKKSVEAHRSAGAQVRRACSSHYAGDLFCEVASQACWPRLPRPLHQ